MSRKIKPFDQFVTPKKGKFNSRAEIENVNVPFDSCSALPSFGESKAMNRQVMAPLTDAIFYFIIFTTYRTNLNESLA